MTLAARPLVLQLCRCSVEDSLQLITFSADRSALHGQRVNAAANQTVVGTVGRFPWCHFRAPAEQVWKPSPTAPGSFLWRGSPV